MAVTWKRIAYKEEVLPNLLAPYAVGDLLYASSTSALSKLADVAVGNVLISGGVGVAPSWGKVALTTHVSGILPDANGGTGAANGWTTAQDPGHKHSALWASDGDPQAAAIDAAGNVNFPLKVSIGEVSTVTSLDLFRTGATTDGVWNAILLEGVKTSNMGDGFGTGIRFRLKDDAGVNNDVAQIAAQRLGADNSGRLGFQTYKAGAIQYCFFIDPDSNCGIGGSTFGTSAYRVLGIGLGTAPSSTPADMAQMWVENINGVADYAGLHKMTETTAQKEVVPGVIIKTDTGSPARPYEGLIEINTVDNKIRMYADAGWRELGTW